MLCMLSGYWVYACWRHPEKDNGPLSSRPCLFQVQRGNFCQTKRKELDWDPRWPSIIWRDGANARGTSSTPWQSRTPSSWSTHSGALRSTTGIKWLHKGPQLRTWSSWGPNYWNGPHFVPILHKVFIFPSSSISPLFALCFATLMTWLVQCVMS